MRVFQKIFAVIVLSVLAQAVQAIPFTFEARSLSMGGVAVATANLATAAWANPAMLTNQPVEDDWSLLIGLGVFLRDYDDLASDIDDYQDADDKREEAEDAGDIPGEAQAILEMRKILGGIDSKVIAPEATTLVAMGISFESFSMAVSARSDAIAGGSVTNISCPLIQPGCDPDELLSDEFNILNVEGVLATEIGISFARDFQLWDRKISIGIKPKFVELDAFTYQESIRTVDADSDLLDKDDNKEDLGTFETIDLGLAYDVSDSVRLGLTLRNLVTDEFDLGDQTLVMDTEARFGVAYHNHFMVAAIDFDLIENEPLLANDSFESLKTQNVAIGAEFNAFKFVKLRVGASKNLASGISDGARDVSYTAGVGIWLGFNLDIAAILSDHSVGAFLQTGFQF
ncbi:MAG: conjugal transfer protein TraF [Gammaproteobacteria bacterium]|nr:conjugal transfer protein TraF [Gammaproteobacteria bacterium]